MWQRNLSIVMLSLFALAAPAAEPRCSFVTLSPSARPLPDSQIDEVLRVARLPGRERMRTLKAESLPGVLELAQKALLLRFQIANTPLSSLSPENRPSAVELATRYPWLRIRPEAALSPATHQGLSAERLSEQVDQLWNLTLRQLHERATPAQRVAFARKLFEEIPHHGTGWLQQTKADQMIDAVLGLRAEEVTRRLQSLSEEEIRRKYGTEQTWFRFGNRNLLTPYFEFQNIMDFLKPKPGQTFVDIGSGMGRMGIYMGIMHPEVKSIGYEIVTDRVKEAERAVKGMGLGNVHFFEQNLADPSFKPEPADIYYAFNPVSGPTFDKIIADLKEQAVRHHKPFKLVVTGPAQYHKLEAQSEWLKEITPARRFADDDFARIFAFDP